jgi:hypothetical protein
MFGNPRQLWEQFEWRHGGLVALYQAAEDTICRMEDRLEEEEMRLQVHP